MDRFTDQLFGRASKDGSVGTDAFALSGTILRGLAKSAAKRAVEIHDPGSSRGHGGGFSSDDFHALGGFMVDMMNGIQKSTGKSEERRRRKHRKRRHRESDQERDIKLERSGPEEEPYVPKYSKRRRRSSGSPLHVTFAEPLEDFNYPPPRKHRRRHHRTEEEYVPEPRYEPRRSSRRSHERRSRRHRPKIDLHSLKSELQDMSSTIISLNARSANHRDCEFYDKFVRNGGRLQDVIGNTLGQIRGWEEEGGYGHSYDEERRERKRRRRERESRY